MPEQKTDFRERVIVALERIEGRQKSQGEMCSEKMCRQGEDLEEVRRTVYGTNGGPGLKLQVDRVEQTLKRSKRQGALADGGNALAVLGLWFKQIMAWLSC